MLTLQKGGFSENCLIYGNSLHNHTFVYCELYMGEGFIFTDFRQEYLPDQQPICWDKATNEQKIDTVLF